MATLLCLVGCVGLTIKQRRRKRAAAVQMERNSFSTQLFGIEQDGPNLPVPQTQGDTDASSGVTKQPPSVPKGARLATASELAPSRLPAPNRNSETTARTSAMERLSRASVSVSEATATIADPDAIIVAYPAVSLVPHVNGGRAVKFHMRKTSIGHVVAGSNVMTDVESRVSTTRMSSAGANEDKEGGINKVASCICCFLCLMIIGWSITVTVLFFECYYFCGTMYALAITTWSILGVGFLFIIYFCCCRNGSDDEGDEDPQQEAQTERCSVESKTLLKALGYCVIIGVIVWLAVEYGVGPSFGGSGGSPRRRRYG